MVAIVTVLATTGMFFLGVLITAICTVLIFLRKEKGKNYFLIILCLCIGAIMILLPLLGLMILRHANGIMDEHYLDMGKAVFVHDEIVDQRNREVFEYNGIKYAEVIPEFFDEEEYIVWCNPPVMAFRPEKAVLNIKRKQSILEVLFNAKQIQTLYKVAPDCGTDILVGDYAFAPIDQLEKVEEYYEDFSHYDRFEYERSDHDEDVISVNLDSEILNKMRRIMKQRHNTQDEGIVYSISCTSSDKLFVGSFDMLNAHGTWYLRSGEVELNDEIEDTFIKLPDDFDNYFDAVFNCD